MRRRLEIFSFALLFLSSLLVGCANPAADAPKAEVEDLAETPAPEETAAADDAMAAGVEYGLAGTIGFVGSKVTGSHEGGFEAFEGTATVVDGQIVGSKVELTIDTTSLWADSERLTGHLKSADFFEVETYPTSSFASSSIAAQEDGTYLVTGALDLHGVEKEISFPASIELTAEGFQAKAEFSINRFDFGIEYPGKKDDLIREEVLIRFDLQSAADEAAAPADEAAAPAAE